jgi:integrase
MTTKRVAKRRDGRRTFGSVREQTNGRWQARYTAPDGGGVTGPHTFATKTDATLWLNSEQAKIHSGTWVSPKASQRQFADYTREWLQHRKGRKGRPLAPRTRELYQQLIRLHIIGDDSSKIPPPSPRIGQVPLGRLSSEDIRKWHTDRTAHSGATQVRQAYSLLRAIFNTAIEDGLLAPGRNPCKIKGAGQNLDRDRQLLEWSDVQALADAIDPYLRTAVLLTFDAHLRLGELLAVQRRDVDLQRKVIYVRRQVVRTKLHDDESRSGRWALLETDPKADSIREVPLTSWCADLLREHLTATSSAGSTTTRLFTRPDGSELQHHHVHAAWKKTRESVGLDWARFHDLRAAGLTLVAQLGATLRETQARAGHATVGASMKYQRKANERRSRVLADLLQLHAEQEAQKLAQSAESVDGSGA